MLGRVPGISGSGSGLTARTLGATFGEENHQLVTAELPSHTHTQNAHSHTQTGGITPGSPFIGGFANGTGTVASTVNVGSTTATNNNTGSDTPHNVMQPTTFMNIMIKL